MAKSAKIAWENIVCYGIANGCHLLHKFGSFLRNMNENRQGWFRRQLCVGKQEYGPFGEVIRSTGPMARANPIRFSSKYDDNESDLLYYGYRYYKALTGTWLSRDPINERGGKNLYEFVGNVPVTMVDGLGLEQLCYYDDHGVWTCRSPLECTSCKVNSVSISHDSNITVLIGPAPADGQPNRRQAFIGVKVHYSLDSTGDASKCKCKYQDAGSITGSYTFLGQNFPVNVNFDGSAPHEFDGAHIPGVDSPGDAPYMGPLGGTLSASFNYAWTGTFSCQGTDGSSDSKSTSINGPFSGSFPIPSAQ